VRSLVYYVSGHGFGHAVRSAEVIRALQRHRPALPIHLRTSAPDWLFSPTASFTSRRLDVGVVQPNALEIDAGATLACAADLARAADRLVAEELPALRAADTGLIVADVPVLAFLAARAADLPSVAVANFGWDWIYQAYVVNHPEYAWLLDWVRDAYSQADLLLRLPFHDTMSAFRTIEDVPLVSRPPSAKRAILRDRLGLGPTDRVVLLSFGGLGLSGLRPEPFAELHGYTFLATRRELAPSSALPPNLRLLPTVQENYNDLVAAADLVVSKPGFGIVASCLANRVPLLYTDRGSFAEYPILRDGLHASGRGYHIPAAELLAGRLGPYLAAIERISSPWPPLRTDGADVIATRLLALLDGIS
jgi:hypothetical protein